VVGGNLKVSVRAEETATVLCPAGELDLASYPQLERALERAAELEPETVVLDLAKLEFMDIAGLRSVLRAGEHLKGAGKRLQVTNPGARIVRLLKLTQQTGALGAELPPE
jgi:anti-sigma B factor antagonist